MPLHFQLPERIIGFPLNTAAAGETVRISTRELIGPMDTIHLMSRLEQLQRVVIDKIPGLPSPSMIDHLVILIHQDLSGIAYCNELRRVTATITPTREIKANTPVLKSDIEEIHSVDLGINIPSDVGLIIIRSMRWYRSLYFDFGPLVPDYQPVSIPIEKILAQQTLLLLGFPLTPSSQSETSTGETRLDNMSNGIRQLKELLHQKCEEESEYQKLLEKHPWMFGRPYTSVDRHTHLDDKNIPDFTAVRCYDNFRDIIELKQPFLPCFKHDNKFGAGFNDAWNQTERYLCFVNQQSHYLQKEKGLNFENPRCLLVIGYSLSHEQQKAIRDKQSHSHAITIFTYDNLLSTAEYILGLMKSAGDPIFPNIEGSFQLHGTCK